MFKSPPRRAEDWRRIADHATDIAEDVVYLKEGAIIATNTSPGRDGAGPGCLRASEG